MAQRPSWDSYFLSMAQVAATRSTCVRAQVGAVIVDGRKKIKATGYNGPPHGVVSCLERGLCRRQEEKIPSGTRYETCRAIHAEQNAIIQAGEEACVGSTIYVFGHAFVCILCRRFILQAGISRVVLQKAPELEILDINPGVWLQEI